MIQSNSTGVRFISISRFKLLNSNIQFALIVSVASVVALLYARDLFGFSISKFTIMSVTIIPAVFLSHASLVYYILFLLPLMSGLPGNYIWPVLLIGLLYKNPHSIDSKGMTCFITIAVFELLHYVLYRFTIDIPNLIGYLSTIFFLCYLAMLQDSKVKNTHCVVFFVLGLFAFLFAIWYITQINHQTDMLLEEGGRLGKTKQLTGAGDDVMMLSANPNGLGYFSLIGLSLVFMLYTLQKIRIWFMLLLSSVFVYVGSLSVSRTWLFGVIFLLGLLFFFTLKSPKKGTGLRIVILLIIFAISIFALSRNELIYQAFFNRFSDDSVATAGSRTEIFKEYNQFFLNNPLYLLFGAGAVHYHDVISEIFHATHNGTQQLIASYGLVGLFTVIVMLVNGYKRNYRKGFFICAIPFFLALFFVQSGQLLNPHHNLYPFIISFVAMRLIDDDYMVKS